MSFKAKFIPLRMYLTSLLSTRPITKIGSQDNLDDKMLSFLREWKDYTWKGLQNF